LNPCWGIAKIEELGHAVDDGIGNEQTRMNEHGEVMTLSQEKGMSGYQSNKEEALDEIEPREAAESNGSFLLRESSGSIALFPKVLMTENPAV
jgi:hypothetical protein